MSKPSSPFVQILTKRHVVVCVGAGGVGKTTVSASLGVGAATLGRRALVLTVDPARRLANALGLENIREDIQHISAAELQALGIDCDIGFDVAMLDVKSTFDRVVTRLAPNPKSAEAILNNRFYRHGSSALAGSQEYMAMARLNEVVHQTDYDVIILDTPPSAHALDFLEAPQRMIDLFESSAFRVLLKTVARKGRVSGLFRADGLVMQGLNRFTSSESFSSLLDFFALLSSTFDGFIETASEVMALLRSSQTAFVVVSACDQVSTQEGHYLAEKLYKERMEIGAWICNRVLLSTSESIDALAVPSDQSASELSVDEIGAIATARAAMVGLSLRDRAHLQHLRQSLADQHPLHWLP
ncbi:MAG TPA: hypothetical protein DCQ06_05230, partial [Myxococcales bacterium]|nr:hypothetical protein [Myxococcales bacterium]